MEGDNTVLTPHTQRDMNGGNEAVSQHVSQTQGGLQTAGEATAVVQSLQLPQQKVSCYECRHVM